ncbi:sensor histidine kinase [Aquabacterium sp.]|uniref:sensor histidine kinase n=1 Tax=Aquabacterium sp. TaxID=1872578 RepID=UPI00378489D2
MTLPASAEAFAPALPRLHLRPLHALLYVAFWAAVGLFLAIAELQHYVQRGGQHRWEPFLWELSSSLVVGLLMLGLFAGHRALVGRGLPWPRLLLWHAGGALLYVLLHSALMYALRAIVYALTGVVYEPGDVASVLAYEGAKDLVSYALMVGLCHGALLYLLDQQRRAAWQRLNEELAAARLARLQEQIQPHFLFNALNLVSAVMYEDLERADRLLAELCELLRLSLDAGRQPTHSLREELRLVTPFLSIMRQRFEGRLHTAIEVSDEAAACALPSLLLMAPLENAVKHGVAHSAAPVSLSVQAAVREGRLEIRVCDSAAAAGLSTARTPALPGSGIGLANTRERLATMYGEAASVSLTREDAGTVLCLQLPAHAAGSESAPRR